MIWNAYGITYQTKVGIVQRIASRKIVQNAKGGDDMQDYKEIAKKMQDEAIVKAVCGKYVIYRRDWLYEHIEQECVLIKSAKEMKPIKDGITRLREWMKENEKDN